MTFTATKPITLPRLEYAHNSVRTFHILLAVLLITSFGPYVISSFRVEHFVIYPLAALAVSLRWRTIIDRVLGSGMVMLGSWVLMLLVATVAIAHTPVIEPRWGYGFVPAGIDTMLMPLLVALIVIGFAPRPTTAASLWFACKVIVVLGVANGAISIITVFIPEWAELLRPFWGAAEETSTVAHRAMELGRYSGVFNQPAEAGLFYSVAGVAAIAVYAHKPLKLWPPLMIIAVGGMFTVSKVFLFIGLPIALIYLLTRGSFGQRVTHFATLTAMATAVFYLPFVQTWSGLEYLIRFADLGQHEAVELFTAGRWNEGSTLLGVFDFIYLSSPLIGVGFRGVRVPYDSAWAEIVVFAGFIGVGLMVIVHVALFLYSALIKDRDVRSFGIVLWMVLTGAAFGISSLTLNRVSVLVWVIIAIIVCLPKDTPDDVRTARVGRITT